MKVLFLGDVVGQGGCDKVRLVIPPYKKNNNIDIVIANGENSAEGNGILPSSAKDLIDSGVDVITTGNHALRRREIYDLLDQEDTPIIRPANFHCDAPGKGVVILDMLRYSLAIVNLQGTIYMDNIKNPFDTIDEILAEINTPNIIVDFHCEATSEKKSMGFYLDGRVSAVIGTHTHVQTADETILPNQTGYITDVGMCGGEYSVLGVKTDLVIKRMKTNLPTRFETEKEDCAVWAVEMDINTSNGKCNSIKRIKLV